MHLRRRWRGWCAPAIVGLAIHPPALAGVPYYVDGSVSSSGDGLTWLTAFRTIEEALCHASSEDEDEIRIRGASGTFDGIYVPSGDYGNGTSGCLDCEAAQFTGQDRHFRLKHNVRIYGGFEGNEGPGSQGLRERVEKIRDDSHPTTLSGDLGQGAHAYHVVRSERDCGLDDETLPFHLIDGVHVVGGRASGDGEDAVGGGLYRRGTSLVAALCTFEGNGAGEAQSSVGAGGAVAIDGPWTPVNGPLQETFSVELLNCTLRGNFVAWADSSAVKLIGGGAVLVHDDPESTNVRIVNSLLHDNAVNAAHDGGRGGAIAVAWGSAKMINCTIMNNQVTQSYDGQHAFGGGIEAWQSNSSVEVVNSIVWGNAAEINDAIDGGLGGAVVTATDIDDWGVTPQCSPVVPDVDGNIACDPLVDSDYKLTASSPVRDLGWNDELADVPDVYDLDQDGIAGDVSGGNWEVTPDRMLDLRIMNWCVDMGAFEFLVSCATDFDGDHATGFSDLLAVLSAWGPCSGCVTDLDGSGDTGFADLLIVLSAWGPCTEPGATVCAPPDTSRNPPQSIADCIARIGLNDPEKLQACIEAMMLNGTP